MSGDDIKSMVDRQLACWPEAASRHASLAGVEIKETMVDGVPWRVMYNPSRSISTTAMIDAASIKARPCFLCAANRPSQQISIACRGYDILVNPYPVFPGHLTIALGSHELQNLMKRVSDMVELAGELDGYTLFYNGPLCGASAPDHCHFQAVPERYLPLKRDYPFSRIYLLASRDDISTDVMRELSLLPVLPGEAEPRVNVALHRRSDGVFEAVIIPRRAHRPSCYSRVKVSPGAIDMLGTVITTSAYDFNAVNGELLSQIFSEVAVAEHEPQVRVGIMTAPEIHYTLHGDYRCEGDTFYPLSCDCSFDLDDVAIGIGFHWERHERQSFRGALQLMEVNGGITAVNIVPLEEYLTSVISSEMSAEASPALLRAHAVISRGWVMKRLRHDPKGARRMPCGPDETLKWYDDDDHEGFDVCADDHCQRYQGITRITREEVREAVMCTRGEVMMYDGKLCDTRFSKCCGGVFEEFEYCWEPEHHPYLAAARDLADAGMKFPDLTRDEAAVDWIMSRPDAFCSQASPAILRQVLNDYDLATTDFYRWKVSYTTGELSEIVSSRSGIDFGDILELRPLARGKSGRIYRLLIVGTKCRHIVGKELEIRKWLSRSHLYSSAFVVVKTDDGFELHGAGWGHGAGLCQIGAAVMGAKGYGYRSILLHYFKNAEIRKIY